MRTSRFIVWLLIGLFSLGQGRAAVIYRETFGIAPGATVDSFATAFDWVRFDAFGQEIITSGSASGVNYTVNGRPIDVSNVNAGPNNDGTYGPYANGILYFAAAAPSLGFTTEFVVDPALYEPGSIVFSWYEGNNTAPHSFRLLVRAGGAWYASAETFTTPAVSLANFGTQSELKSITYDPAASLWLQVNFDGDFTLGESPGTGFSTPSALGDLFLGEPPSADLSGPITAFGVYGEHDGTGTGNRRIDTFTIEATPLVINPSKVVLWTGNVSADWDLLAANWRDQSGASVTYAEGDIAHFDDSAASTEVNLIPQVLPASVTVSNQTKTYKFTGGGSIGGSASLFKGGGGTLILGNANNSFSGGVLIVAGTVQVGEGGTTGAIGEGNITNNAALVVNRDGSLVLSNMISGTGTLTKSGNGTLVLAGASSYTGASTLSEGALLVNGNLASPVTTGLKTTLGGFGTINSPVSVAGVLNPGDGYGTLTIGRLTMFGGATNVFDLGTTVDGPNDFLEVTGDLSVTNNPIVLNLLDAPQTGVAYPLIHYSGVRSGIFDLNVIVTGFTRYTAQLAYNDAQKTVSVTFVEPAIPPTVIYRETFGIAPGASVDSFATAFDWVRFDDFGQEVLTSGSASGVNYTVNGRPIDVANVNAGPNNDGAFDPYANGILYFAATPSPSLGFTTEYVVDPTKYKPGSIVFSWYEGNNTAPQSFRLLVRVDGKWYASASTFLTPAVSLANFGTQSQLKTITYDPAAANWLEVNFDGDFTLGEVPGTGFSAPSSLGALALGGAPAAALSGSITAFGVYGESGGGTGNRRIDTFTIEAIPLDALRPTIMGVQKSGDNIVISGNNGSPNRQFRILTSTELTAPIATWSVAATGNFDATGAFTANATFTLTENFRFFAVQVP